MNLDRLSISAQRKVMHRPTKEARGRTFTFERAKRSILSGQRLSPNALSLLVRGTCDRLCWMSNNYYRMNSNTKVKCHCCGQALPKMRKLNTAGRRRFAAMKRRRL